MAFLGEYFPFSTPCSKGKSTKKTRKESDASPIEDVPASDMNWPCGSHRGNVIKTIHH